jgi:hypothetical protein
MAAGARETKRLDYSLSLLFSSLSLSLFTSLSLSLSLSSLCSLFSLRFSLSLCVSLSGGDAAFFRTVGTRSTNTVPQDTASASRTKQTANKDPETENDDELRGGCRKTFVSVRRCYYWR